jgi:hypothetical protein
MTRRQLAHRTALVIGLYGGAIATAVLLHERSPSLYDVYRDSVPIIVALPAAWLASAFQRRLSYMQALRNLWSDAIDSVHAALRYTENPSPSPVLYASTLSKLGITIEHVRAVFKNVDEREGTGGLYPFEHLKLIYAAVADLGYGDDVTDADRRAAKINVVRHWKGVRARLLLEFDRATPTYRGDLVSLGPFLEGHRAHAPDAPPLAELA